MMLAPSGKRIKPEHSYSNNPSPGPRPRSAENPSAVALSTGAVPATAAAAFIVPSVTAANAAMVTSKPQQWRNAGMKFISYTPTTVTTSTGIHILSNNINGKIVVVKSDKIVRDVVDNKNHKLWLADEGVLVMIVVT